MIRIPSDIQVPVTTPRSGVLEALGLRVGQVFTGEVVGQTLNGTTQLQIGGQQITLTLPGQPQLGQLLQFQIKSAGAKPELVLLTNNPATPAPTAQTATAQANTASVSTATPLPNTQAAPLPPATNSQPQPAAAPPLAAEPAPAPVSSQPSSAAPAPAGNAALPPTSLPLPAGVRAELNLQPGQVVTAQVAPPSASGQAQIAIGTQQVAATLPGNPAPGTTVQFQVQMLGAEPRLVPLTPGQTVTPRYPASTSPGTQVPTPPPVTTPAPSAVPITPASMAQVISQTAASAAVKQDSVGTLLASLTGLQKQGTSLPNPVAETAARLLASQIDLTKGPPPAAALRAAIAGSGVFLESMMAGGQANPVQQGDIKGLLLLMRNVLGNWLGADEALPPPPDRRPPPPLRGSTPKAHAQNPAPLPQGAEGREAGKHLLSQTDSALARIRLFQLSSLPDAAGRPALPGAAQDLHFELPFVLGQQAGMAQFQISRDAEQDGNPAERGWQMIFSINFAPVGPVGAKVTFRSRKTGVMLWAENEATAEVLEEMLPELVEGLEAQGLEPGAIRVRRAPPEASPPPPSGGFVDSVS
ncbi:flagellar hook-length control protein FliK [Mariluticola halotolerans]|uniref:flagellar hook-length control protein FliK n=1 Tax=Mariluticola halotolerans TaxID=2909283 RepID=UPI0026E32DAF|nr:flagellar hook-length control protein FliK [Mariluticola halotolerans]UJQ95742.1 flagellar hook-length control protein FliK [Mariluticola halotolerans]